MREAIVEDKRKFVVNEAPKPFLEEDEVLIEVRYCGICGSDLHTYLEGVCMRHGHELSGDIVKVGSAVHGWEVGDRVTVESNISCGECFWCKRGETGLCENFYVLWAQCAGGFATYTKAKYRQLHKLHPSVSYKAGAMVEPLAVALHAVRLSGIGVGDVVAVLGLGPLGQLVLRLANISGARAVYATETSKSRLELARVAADEVIDVKAVDAVGRILELTGGRGPDLIFECSGAAAAIQQSIALVRSGGTIVLVGVGLLPVETPFSQVVLREVNIKGSMNLCSDDFATALNLIKDKKIDVAPLITSVVPLEDINKAFEEAVSGEGGKILIKP